MTSLSKQTLVLVDLPWGWIWWDTAIPLVAHDPDVVDRRVRYPQSTIDWPLVAAAVDHAVAMRSPVRNVHVDCIAVSSPHVLGPQEHGALTRWLTGGAGIQVRLCDPHLNTRHVGDGRHRLWGSWPHFAEFVPVMSDTALLFENAYPKDKFGIASDMKAKIAREYRWWTEEAPRRLASRNTDYIANLATCHSLL